MKKVFASVVVSLALVVPFGVLGATSAFAARPASHPAKVSASQARVTCPAYSTSGNCVTVPSTGKVSAVLCGELFVGTAAPGSTITCATVSQMLLNLACPATERADSVSISGTNLDITVAGATIYKFNPATGTSTIVPAILGSGGEFTKVFGSCPTRVVVPTLPVTGGAAGGPLPSTPGGAPLVPLGIAGLLLVLAGAAVTVRNRITQV